MVNIMDELFNLDNVLTLMHDTVLNVFEFDELQFKTKIDENSCSVYCDEIKDDTYERKLGIDGFIEFKYSHENSLELIVTFSDEKAEMIVSRLSNILEEENLFNKFICSVSEYKIGETKLSFTVKYLIEYEDNIGTYTDAFCWYLINIMLAI